MIVNTFSDCHVLCQVIDPKRYTYDEIVDLLKNNPALFIWIDQPTKEKLVQSGYWVDTKQFDRLTIDYTGETRCFIRKMK